MTSPYISDLFGTAAVRRGPTPSARLFRSQYSIQQGKISTQRKRIYREGATAQKRQITAMEAEFSRINHPMTLNIFEMMIFLV